MRVAQSAWGAGDRGEPLEFDVDPLVDKRSAHLGCHDRAFDFRDVARGRLSGRRGSFRALTGARTWSAADPGEVGARAVEELVQGLARELRLAGAAGGGRALQAIGGGLVEQDLGAGPERKLHT